MNSSSSSSRSAKRTINANDVIDLTNDEPVIKHFKPANNVVADNFVDLSQSDDDEPVVATQLTDDAIAMLTAIIGKDMIAYRNSIRTTTTTTTDTITTTGDSIDDYVIDDDVIDDDAMVLSVIHGMNELNDMRADVDNAFSEEDAMMLIATFFDDEIDETD